MSLESTVKNIQAQSDLITCFLPFVHRDSDSIKQKAIENMTHEFWMKILNLPFVDGKTFNDFYPRIIGLLLQSAIHIQSNAILLHNENCILHPDII